MAITDLAVRVNKIISKILFCLVLSVMMAGCSNNTVNHDEPKTNASAGQFYLVRHAEKVLGVSDPQLTRAGEDRARALAQLLRDANITRIHSSDTRRTRDTAAPLARQLGLDVEIYDPRDLPAIAEKLKTAGGTHLVVGHSNTTPQLAELLGGDGGAPIVEASEYDRLYIVTIDTGGAAQTALLRFGK